MRQITVSATNVFKVAARELGDATQFLRIMEANGLFDTNITVPTALWIPDIDPKAPKGTPQ
jgi:hypothetical protein